MRWKRGTLLLFFPVLFAACRQVPSTPRALLGQGSYEDPAAAKGVLSPPLRGRLYSDLRLVTEGTQGGAYDVDVSPDGARIVFSATFHSPLPKVFVKDIRKGGVIQKTSGPHRDIQPKFSPDGQWIAFASDREGNFDIQVISARRNEAYWQVTRSTGQEIHPTWSPDGRRIAYCALDEGDEQGEWSLWIVELDGQKRTQLGPGLFPEWSPDGSRLVFQRPSRRGRGWYGIWTVEVEGGAPREVVTSAEHGAIHPSWDPSSQRIVYATARSPLDRPWEIPQADDLWVIDLAGGPPYRLTEHPASDYAPMWGLDGRVYFTSQRDGVPRIWSVRPFETPALFPRDRDVLSGEEE
ncbi:MAG: TolB family protein [Planctomycetota bacterium]